jgi:hypothetical protein
MTFEEINNLSWLDFTIYVERMSKLYEEDEKQKLEEKKAKIEMMNSNFEALANIMAATHI